MGHDRIIWLMILIVSLENTNSKYLGGTVRWEKVGDKVRFIYRLTFEKATGPCGPTCSINSIGKLGTPLQYSNWFCCGCSNTIVPISNQINYFVTSLTSTLEQGEGQFEYKFTGNGPFKVFTNFMWSTPSNGPGKLQTVVDLHTRNDTHLPDGSPVAALPPYIGIPLGCQSSISLPVTDPDADPVRCRLASPSECGAACTTLPRSIQLDMTNCVLLVTATEDNGYKDNTDYRITVTLEDMPEYTLSIGGSVKSPQDTMSSSPLQFTVRVKSTSSACNALHVKPINVMPSGIHLPPPGPRGANFTFTLQSDGTRPFQTVVSGPAGTAVTETTVQPTKTRVQAKWMPQSNQNGLAFFCAWGIQNDGFTTTQSNCLTTITNDNDNCLGSPCKNGGTCIDLYKRYACKCTLGYKPPDCTQRASCKTNDPCRNGGQCESVGSTLRCVCPTGYTGPECTTRILSCSSSPCENGGTCDEDLRSFRCRCTPGFTGQRCEKAFQPWISSVKSTLRSLTALTPTVQLTNKDGSSQSQSQLYVYGGINRSSAVNDAFGKMHGMFGIKDKNKQAVNVSIDNSGAPLWQILVAVAGVIIALAAVGCCFWFCGPWRRGQHRGTVDSPKWVRRPRTTVEDGGDKEIKRQSNAVSNNSGTVHQLNVKNMENSGVIISGGSPKFLNIYKSSVNDPFFHKTGLPSRLGHR